MLLVSMPKSATAVALVESAAKCLATAEASPSCSTSHFLAECAFVIVSWVVNVLEATRKSVVSAGHCSSVSAMCEPSTFETKSTFMSRLLYDLSASVTMTGPRSLPPMPMLTTCVIGLPVKPFHTPPRTLSTKGLSLSSTAFTSGITSLPSTRIGVLARLRSATCSTARPSVALILSPENMRCASSLTLAVSARPTSSFIVSSVAMFFE
mmetsp:Transcript_18755/g.44506  ORF Transcript_18755/g.44506 Transcript_18755/m.44506 type:complete len:209 (-) Transcript_18755:185-811(-)